VPVYERLIKAIRAVDHRHMFTIEGYNWANNWSLFDKPLDNNIVYQFHYYCWNNPDNLNDIGQYLVKQQQLNVPVWVGETGEKNNTIYFATTQYFEKNNIGWSFWPWKKMETKNTPYSFRSPEGWNEIVAYSKGGSKPASEVKSEKIFNDLLENIKISNCSYFPDVVHAMFRRIPVKIEAENYGHNGYLKSYFVRDTLSKSAYYRTKEPVKVTPFGKDNQEQAVELKEGEWVVFNVKSNIQFTRNVFVHIKALTKPAMIVLSVNGAETGMKIESAEWIDLKVNAYKFETGENQIKVFIETGSVQLDWVEVQ